MFDSIIIGGGAAGFFGAINLAEQKPGAKILILEKSSRVLEKVKISGGGRCNVTHACFDPQDLIKFYPRGEKELLGPFHKFMTYDVISWFSEREVELKTEEDGRMFPVTDNSQTIIDCFLREVKQRGVKLNTNCGVKNILPNEAGWEVQLQDGNSLQSKTILVATGSSPVFWNMLAKIGHKIESPVPSLFTFNIKDKRLEGLMGISVPDAEVVVKDSDFAESGPLLITHWGLSGPAVLKLSARAAKELHQRKYRFSVLINFIAGEDNPRQALVDIRREHPAKKVIKLPLFGLPSRLWQSMINTVGVADKNFADLSTLQTDALLRELTAAEFEVNGKSTFKEEFVTCGGVSLGEIDMRTMESRIRQGLYFAGEVVDIDAVTGGFNFQAAWTTSHIAAKAISQVLLGK